MRHAGTSGVDESKLRYATGNMKQEIDRVFLRSIAECIGDRWFHREMIAEQVDVVRRTVERVFQEDSLREGVAAGELATRLHLPELLAPPPPALSGFRVERGVICRQEDGGLSEEVRTMLEKLLRTMEEAGTFVEESAVPGMVNMDEKDARKLLGIAVKSHRIVRLPAGLLLHAGVRDGMVDRLVRSGLDVLSVAEVKEMFNISRKYAIPFLEYLDGEKITARRGDRRILLHSPQRRA